MTNTQLPLAVQLRDEATLDNFWFSDRLLPLRALLQDPGEEQSLFVHGPSGSGRSHLLQAACQNAASGTALYLPMADMHEMSPEAILDGIEGLDLVCLDDLQWVVGSGGWEEALFHLINRSRETGCTLFFAADAAPSGLSISLKDLASRLAWSTVFQLAVPADEEKQRILQFRAGRRGMTLDDDVARYILSRASRDMSELIALLDRLDRDSITRKRPLTIPFVKESLDW